MKLFKKADLILIACILFVCLLLFIPKFFDKGDKKTGQIYIDGEVVAEYDLASVEEETYFSTDTNPNCKIKISKGEMKFVEAECKDKLCINSGAVKRNSDTAACLPAKVVIAVKSEKNDIQQIAY